MSQPTLYCCSRHAQEMDSETGRGTTGNSGPSAPAGACHRRSAALSHFPAMSAVLCLDKKLPKLPIAGADQEPSTQLTHLRINDQVICFLTFSCFYLRKAYS